MFVKKKIFAFSLISAVTLLLILCCILVMLGNKNFEKEYAFSLGMPPDENFYENVCGCSLEKLLSFRDYKTYEISLATDKQRTFSQIQYQIRSIVQSKDGQNGVHVKLGKKTKYEDIIRILDICQIEKAPTYILKDYDIWIMAGRNLEMQENCPFKYPYPKG